MPVRHTPIIYKFAALCWYVYIDDNIKGSDWFYVLQTKTHIRKHATIR